MLYIWCPADNTGRGDNNAEIMEDISHSIGDLSKAAAFYDFTVLRK